MSVALVTAIFGGYDTLKPLPEGHGFDDAVCVTDDRTLAADGWRTTVQVPLTMSGRLAAKSPKCRPDLYTDCDRSLWVDGSFAVHGVPGPEHEFAQYRHPDRDCLFDEVAHSGPLPKYAGDDLTAQARCYRKLGMPEHWGLWGCGLIVRRHTVRMAELGSAWLSEIHAFGVQDQVSHPFVCWQHDLRPVDLTEGHLFDNPLATYVGHLRSD